MRRSVRVPHCLNDVWSSHLFQWSWPNGLQEPNWFDRALLTHWLPTVYFLDQTCVSTTIYNQLNDPRNRLQHLRVANFQEIDSNLLWHYNLQQSRSKLSTKSSVRNLDKRWSGVSHQATKEDAVTLWVPLKYLCKFLLNNILRPPFTVT